MILSITKEAREVLCTVLEKRNGDAGEELHVQMKQRAGGHLEFWLPTILFPDSARMPGGNFVITLTVSSFSEVHDLSDRLKLLNGIVP